MFLDSWATNYIAPVRTALKFLIRQNSVLGAIGTLSKK